MKNRPRQKLSPLQQSRLRKICLFLVCVGVLWVLFAPGNGIFSLLKQRSNLKGLEIETRELSKQNEKLEGEIDKLQDDQEYLEEIARRDYGMLKKNERVYDFSKPEKKKEE